jgi:hypothetical protein
MILSSYNRNLFSCSSAQNLAQNCTSVHICVQFSLIFVNFVRANNGLWNNLATFAAVY